MKKLLVSILVLTSLSTFANEEILTCTKVIDTTSFSIVVEKDLDSNTSYARVYEYLLNTGERHLLFSNEIYLMDSPTDKKLSFVIDAHTNGSILELEMKEVGRVNGQLLAVGKLELNTASLSLETMDCYL